jgi:hypothetical protein
MINIISYKRTLLAATFAVHETTWCSATWKWHSISIHCGTSSLFYCDCHIKLANYKQRLCTFSILFSIAFVIHTVIITTEWNHLLTPQGCLGSHTFLNFLQIWVQYVPMRPLSFIFNFYLLWKIVISFVLIFFPSKSQRKTDFHSWINWDELHPR